MGMTIEYLTGSTGSFYPLGYEPGIYYANLPVPGYFGIELTASAGRQNRKRAAGLSERYWHSARESFFRARRCADSTRRRARRAWIQRPHALGGRIPAAAAHFLVRFTLTAIP